MIEFCGYNFCIDEDSLNPFPLQIKDLNKIRIENGVYDHMNIEKNINNSYNENIPNWNLDTILDASFDNGIGSGNVDFTISQLSSIKIKRRKNIFEDRPFLINEDFEDLQWVTIKEIEVNDSLDLSTILRDYLVPSNESFEYAVVPVLNGIEGEYIKESIFTQFNGVFIYDLTNNFKLDKNVSYGNNSSIQEIGQLIPLGRKYPIVIKNGNADYDTGSISAIILGRNYDKTHIINRKEVVEQIENFKKFLKNGKAKVIKDWNGNIKIIRVVGNPSVSYNNNYGMGIGTATFEWIEQGKYNNEEDLYENNLVEKIR